MSYKSMKITFKENCDVWYEIILSNYNSKIFSHIVDYPIDKIEIDDIDSIYPVYKSEMQDGRTLIEIKEINIMGRPSEIILRYVKKEFLKPIKRSDGKTTMRYIEDIEIDLSENEKEFCLNVHSPFSYISAIKNNSTAKFNDYSFAPRDLSPIFLKQSGIMKIDWELEIIEEKKKANTEEVQQNAKRIYKLERYYDNPRQYEWLNEIGEKLVYKRLLKTPEIFLHNRIEDILNGSCFYLSAGADITPIIALQDKIQTFIFCDDYGNYPNSNCCIEDLWLKIYQKLETQNFKKIATINIDKTYLKIRDYGWNIGDKLEKVAMSLWEKNKKLFCLIYLNWDNSMAFHRLYVENRVIPKAICEICPEGGSIGQYSNSKIKIPYIFRMPEYAIGHQYSLANPEEYELITDTIKYFGDYGNTYGNAGTNNGINMYKRKTKS